MLSYCRNYKPRHYYRYSTNYKVEFNELKLLRCVHMEQSYLLLKKLTQYDKS